MERIRHASCGNSILQGIVDGKWPASVIATINPHQALEHLKDTRMHAHGSIPPLKNLSALGYAFVVNPKHDFDLFMEC